jgi:hypothetical protein
MAEPLLETVEKQPAENFPFAVNFSKSLPAGATLSSVALSAVNVADDSDATATVLTSSIGTVVGGSAVARLRAGDDGETYKVTYLATLSDGSVLEEDILLVATDR